MALLAWSLDPLQTTLTVTAVSLMATLFMPDILHWCLLVNIVIQ